MNENKSILIITGYFLPYCTSFGGCVRVLALADFLYKNDFDVHILSTKRYFHGYRGYEDVAKNFKTVFIGKEKNASLTAERTNYKSKISIKNRIKHFIRSLVDSMIVLDIEIFKFNQLYKEAVKIISENNVTNIIISTPPHSLNLLCLKLKKQFKDKVNIIVDYRDSWNTSKVHGNKNILTRPLSNYLEKKILLACDHFTFVSNPMLKNVNKKFNIDISSKSVLVMNGYMEEIKLKNNLKQAETNIKIGYFGSISDWKKSPVDASILFDFFIKHYSDMSDIELHLYGNIELKQYQKSDFKNIFVHDSIPHKEALQEMSRMDYLLMVQSSRKNSEEMITGKFFEYISMKKIIICIGPDDMEAKKIIDKYNLGINADIFDDNDMLNKFKTLRTIDKSKFYQDVDISIFKRENQYKNFLKIIK